MGCPPIASGLDESSRFVTDIIFAINKIMSFEKVCCYRSKCTHRCNDAGTQESEIQRLRANLAGLREADCHKNRLLEEIN
jgi:pyrroloquinoline quinone (PQQ) biosynthesis protein C